MTSRAKEGPDRNTAGCFLWSALGMISDIICPVDTSSPLLTLMIGRSGGSMPCNTQALAADHQHTTQHDQIFLHCWMKCVHTLMLSRKRRLCCTGTACTANWASVRASTTLVVAFTLLGNKNSCVHVMQTVEQGIPVAASCKQAGRRQALVGREARCDIAERTSRYRRLRCSVLMSWHTYGSRNNIVTSKSAF